MRMLLRFLQRRTIWWPTLLGWISLTAFAGLFLTLWWFRGEALLSLTERQPAEVLVVEGWIGLEGVHAAAIEFAQGGYRQVVATGGADIGTAWLPNMLQSREGGTDLVSIAQIFQRSGTRMASFKDKNITDPKSMAGKKIGSWLGGNEPELFAGLTKAGLDPTKENIIKQNFDMSGLLKGDLDVAQAMIYNEYAQVLEVNNPATGKLYQPSDLNVVDFNDPAVGTAMLQDQIFARSSWLSTGDNAATATKFLTATYRGWIYCRDNQDKCVQIVLKAGSQLGASHQAWQMNEINALVWPSPGGVGQLDQALYQQTVTIATTNKVLKAAPSPDAVRTDLAKAALAALPSGTDANGAGFKKATVTLNAGGN